jgi:hypothetical protein
MPRPGPARTHRHAIRECLGLGAQSVAELQALRGEVGM